MKLIGIRNIQLLVVDDEVLSQPRDAEVRRLKFGTASSESVNKTRAAVSWLCRNDNVSI